MGLVSAAFLADIWRIPHDALFKMMERSIDDVYPPRPIYKGYAVFRIKEVKAALESGFAAAESEYVSKVKSLKKFDAFNQWFNSVKEKAQIKAYNNIGKEGGVS